MKTTQKQYDILSITSDGDTVAVCTTEAKTPDEARRNTANFCMMMDIKVTGIRETPPTTQGEEEHVALVLDLGPTHHNCCHAPKDQGHMFGCPQSTENKGQGESACCTS